jgi:hypothetical protein
MKRFLAFAASAAFLSSVIGAVASAQTTRIDTQERHAVIVRVAKELRDRYVFRDKAGQAAEALLADERRGRFAEIQDGPAFAQAVTAALRERLHDLHLFVEYSAQAEPEPRPRSEPTIADYEKFRAMVARGNYGIDAVQRLAGNIGYLRISGFPDADLMMNPLMHAMSLVAGTDALIVDMRGNHGGDPASVNLLTSYFFVPWKSLHLNDIFRRAPGTSEMNLQQYWNVPVAGPLYLDRPVYILTDAKTFSGGEGFAYAMQAEHRATVVGGVTGGGANPMKEIWIDEHFTAAIPNGYASNPVTKTNWEGVGVHPDVMVPANDALKISYTTLLKQHLLKSADAQERDELQKLIDTASAHPESILEP